MPPIRSTSLGVAALLAVFAGIAVGTTSGGSVLDAGVIAGRAVPAGAQAPVDVAFLGDSYTFGTGASTPSDGYAYLVAKAEHWSARIVGLPGSGYVRYATDTQIRIDTGITSIVASHPKLVIVECGHNDADRGIDLARVEPNALKDLRRLRTALPRAPIVVLGPIWLSQEPTPSALAVRDAVHAAQRQIPDSRWIDPIAQQWFTGVRRLRTGDDRTMINYSVGHPNDLGYEHIAKLLEADLKQLGLTRPRRLSPDPA